MRAVLRLLGILAVLMALSACQTAKNDQKDMLGVRFADPHTEALAEAAADGDVAKIDEELRAGAQINGRGTGGITPLFYALSHRNNLGYHALLERGADPNLQMGEGDSVISFTTLLGESILLQDALAHGGNPNLLDKDTFRFPTPLFNAIAAQSESEVSILIKAGANLNAMSSDGTPLMAAAAANEYEIVYTLLLAGADFNIKDKSGHTVVWYFENSKVDPQSDAYGWWEKSAEFLKQNGIEVHAK